ncbi:MAG: DNA polymerase III subunit gamma/tau [Gemmataceae bacterium]|nr:DNA polymerase III subunit gamma/tau [Gemmataceae bacterium]
MAKKKAAASPSTATSSSATDNSTEYTVLARRYRPQQFADLVGQEPVAQALVNAIKSNRVAHAYLFTGARGVGKTSAARILAKALNCVKGPTPTPCDECDMCQAIMSGDDTDVLEIDGASNRGIDEVREIRANVQYRPSRARCKIYIIDEVHMLTPQAFNALLKTLEEPPAHVKFIFATTEATKIPVTILSRCQRFDFAGIGLTRILERLRGIVAAEGLQADEEALELIARRAGGSMRDAQSLLDQLLAFGGARLTVERVHELLGTANEERVAEIAAAVIARDPKRVLELLAQVVEQGQQLGELLDQLLEYWRDLMIVQCAGVEGQLLSVTSKHRDALAKHAQQLSADTILAGLDVLATAKTRLRETSHIRVVLEIALVRLCHLENLVSLSQLAQSLANGGVVAGAAAPANTARPALSPAAPAPEKKKPDDAGQVELIALRPENLGVIRQQLISKAGLTIGGELRRVTGLAISAPNTLVFQVPGRYNLRSDQVFEGKRRAEIEELTAAVVGPCQIRVDIVADEANGQPATAGAAPDEAPHVKARRQRAEVLQMPLVAKAVETLGAQLVGVDDDFGKAATPDAVPGSETSSIESVESPGGEAIEDD